MFPEPVVHECFVDVSTGTGIHKGMLRVGETVFPKGEHIKWLPNQYQMISPESTHTNNFIETEEVIFRNICMKQQLLIKRGS